MSEFDDKLGAILGNPDAMSQIMALAQSLGGGQSAPAQQPTPTPPPPSIPPAAQTSAQAPDPSALFGLLGDLDPALIQTGMQLFSEFSKGDDERTALLLALKPFLKKERYAKVDRAVQIARLSRVLRVAFQLFKGRGANDV